MDVESRQASTRRHVLLGAGAVLCATGLGAAGLLAWGGEQRPVPTDSSDSELDALAGAVVSGGPGKDGIPSIDRPRFVEARNADFLRGGDRVFGLHHLGEIKAYPQPVLVWHEIVNDTVGGAPLSVTYCPLTGTAIGFNSPPTESLTFGTTGRLVNSNLLMYDRQTNSEWPQILGTAINGPRKGTRLPTVPLVWTTWQAWRTTYPDSLVLSTDTGALRGYGSDPYGSYTEPSGYYVEPGTYFPVRNSDSRLGDKEIVLGIRAGSDRLAIRKDRIRQDGSISVEVGGVPWRALWDNELSTARVVHAVTGEPADFLDAMWFAWHAFYPDTRLLA